MKNRFLAVKAGLNPPVIPVTSRALVAWVVTAILLWVLYAFLVAPGPSPSPPS